jgi:type IV pilus assembly protein PilV
MKQHGFTLLEVLVAVLIFAIGLLGLASLQAVGQRNNHSAYLRSQAVIQAYDIADRMRVNWDQLDDVYIQSPPGAAPCGGTLTACTNSADVAWYDLWEWNQLTREILPQGTGTISRSTVNSQNIVVAIEWNDTADDNDDADDTTHSSIELEFRPYKD